MKVRNHQHVALTAAILAALCGSAAVPLAAQQQRTENTLTLGENGISAKATLKDVNWLIGHWRGEGLGGTADETWSPALARTMAGTFRLVKENKIVFSEYLIITEENESLVLRLKHFDPDFAGWEEKDKFVSFKLVKIDDRAAYFDGLTYRLNDQGEFDIFVVFEQENGGEREEKVTLRRQSP